MEQYATPPRSARRGCRYCGCKPVQWIRVEHTPREYEPICPECLEGLHQYFISQLAIYEARHIIAEALQGVQR
jgi:hypothetical protein